MEATGVALFLGFVLFVGSLLGSCVQEGSIARDCEREGVFWVTDKRYECALKPKQQSK
jgi:hypothetical protein